MLETIGVSMMPGQTALMRMTRSANFNAELFVMPTMPCFVA
jgi:hypothetical protein